MNSGAAAGILLNVIGFCSATGTKGFSDLQKVLLTSLS
jgi:hypothetical protein